VRGLGGIRSTGYGAELLEDASLVGHYESARSPYCAISLTVVYLIQAVWIKSLESRPVDLRRTASAERGKRGPARDLLLRMDLGCLFQQAECRRSVVTIHPHDAVLG